MEGLKNTFDVEIFFNYLSEKISTDDKEILLCYDEISKEFIVDDNLIDLAIKILIDSNIVRYQYRPFKREFYLY